MFRDEVARIITEHEATYATSGFGDWMWHCACGATAVLLDRDSCYRKTREHWGQEVEKWVSDKIGEIDWKKLFARFF